MIYGTAAEWGTSIVVIPAFWSGGALHQGAPIGVQTHVAGNELVISVSGVISGLNFAG
jgi:hypothetical protein